ncbi:hypothetical protein GSI_09705 [Ganoderma sinense ZZ0214-1]|uniref:Uncharacterized protein n=1 Tax=Ganoderma sinense ZZ0214-1 TaxID=1077348 RepID=A0A2G8S3M4_9APHY|nr:hypothetical protein GSI_09705 [Ganoderma sinense ZZ0214-1]
MATTTAGSSAQASSSSASTSVSAVHAPILATGDWTKNLVHLAKTAELKKHALTLQLHTAHILSAHAALEQKNKAIQDLKEQKNKLESERARLIICLREVNEDRDKTDLAEATLNKEVTDLHAKIKSITEGEYTVAKQDVDRLRGELGQPPLPSLQTTLEEKSAECVPHAIMSYPILSYPPSFLATLADTRLRLRLPSPPPPPSHRAPHSITHRASRNLITHGRRCRYLKALRLQAEAASAATGTKRPGEELGADGQPVKRPRGRPKGSKNSKTKTKPGGAPAASTPSS